MSGDLERYTPPALTPAVWEDLERRVKVLAKSNLVPDHFRGKPDELMVAAIGLHDLGVPPGPQTLSQCYVVKGRPGYMAQLQISLADRAGWEIAYDEAECDARTATVKIRRHGSGDWNRVTFTMADAEKAGLPKQNPTYGSYPDRMLLARAVTKAIGFYCPHVKMALDYSSDHAGQPNGQPAPAGVDAETGEILHRAPDVAARPDEDVVDAELVDEDGPAATPAQADPAQGGLVPESWVQRFATGCRSIYPAEAPDGLTEDGFRHAIVCYATGGRVASAKEVRVAERDAINRAFIDVRAGRKEVAKVGLEWVVVDVPPAEGEEPF